MKVKSKDLRRLVMQFIMLTPFFKPLSFSYINGLEIINYLFSIWQILAVGLGIILYVLKIRNKKPEQNWIVLPLSVFAFFSWFIFSSLVNNQTAISGILSTLVKNVGFVLILQYSFLEYKNRGLDYLAILLKALLAINVIFKLIYVNGFAQSGYYGNFIHFLGNRNGITPIYLFAIVVIYCNYYLKYGTVSRMQSFKMIILTLTLMLFSSGTGIICSALLIAIEFLGKNDWYKRIVNMKTVMITYLALLIVIVFLQMTTQFTWIFDLIGKDATLTHRTEVWQIATSILSGSTKNLFVGLGFASEHGYIYYSGMYYTAHNMILEIMLRGGIIALLLFSFVLLSVRKEFSNKGKNQSQLVSSVNAFLFIFLLNTLVEPLFTEIYFYGILCVGMCTIIMVNNSGTQKLSRNN